MNIILTEQQFRDLLEKQLLESVYINGLKGNTANLSYKKGSDWSNGNLNATDKIKTDKMDTNNGDTYIVPLKGGINSYNITSISGENVMHYFKYYWDSKKATTTLNDKSYELKMQKQEFNNFLSQFIDKVSAVIRHYITENKIENVSKVSIYPVPSSSNFNQRMSEELTGMLLNGLPIQVINQNLFYKDVSNIQRDTDFINKNKEYFNSRYYQQFDDDITNSEELDNSLERFKAVGGFKDYIQEMNDCVRTMHFCLNNYRHVSVNSPRTLSRLAYNYRMYVDLKAESVLRNTYGDNSTIRFSTVATPVKTWQKPVVENSLPSLTVLWLDDMRDPYKYFNKKSNSGAFVRNKDFYDKLMSKYNLNFVWVRNIDEFSKFILKNGLPKFVSFDHDLGAGIPKGLDCAKWLVQYCQRTGSNLPSFFVHSANPNGQREINALLNSVKNNAPSLSSADGEQQETQQNSNKKDTDAFTDAVWTLIKPLLRGVNSPITGKPYPKIKIEYYKHQPYEIKKLSNGMRMGLKNMFSLNPKVLQEEMERIKGTLFVIFDDNISGGATLSDICLQAKNAGIENIVPITFGQMAVKWTVGAKTPLKLTKPTDKNGNVGQFNI